MNKKEVQCFVKYCLTSRNNDRPDEYESYIFKGVWVRLEFGKDIYWGRCQV